MVIELCLRGMQLDGAKYSVNRFAMLSQRVENQYYECLTLPRAHMGIGSAFINQCLMVGIEIT